MSEGTKQNYYTVGVIAGTHALRGEVKVFPRTDFPEKRFRKGSILLLCEAGKTPTKTLKVSTSRQHKQFWLVLFDGVASINDVESWKGLELVVSEEDLLPLPANTYYIHQLIGLEVVSDDGRVVGTITDVLRPGANDVYVVRGNLQPEDVLIPAIPDVVLSVDLETNQMLVHLMPGLLTADDEDHATQDADDTKQHQRNRAGRKRSRSDGGSVATSGDGEDKA